MTKTTAAFSLALAALLLAAAAGCADREHIRDDFGVRTRAFFAKQRVSRTAATGAPTGLDSEEAAVIHADYRNSLGEDTSAAKEDTSRVLLLREAPEAKK